MNSVIAARTRTLTAAAGQGSQLRFIPILGESHDQPPYALLQTDTLPHVSITEISHAGNVPELRVQNGLDRQLFLMDGQELVGAKQNRILNTDVMIAAKSELIIPVSCVEAGRWQHVSNHFVPGKAASHRIRAGKAPRVHQSLKTGQRHNANQGLVWAEVETSRHLANAQSQTSALSDVYAHRQRELTDLRAQLKLPDHAVGLAVFRLGRMQGVDLFDRHSTLAYFWNSLIDSYALDYVATPSAGAVAQADEQAAVDAALTRAAGGNWEQFPSPGLGQDCRLSDDLLSGSALVIDGQTVIHLQLFPRPPPPPAPRRPRIARRWMSE